MRAGMGFIAGNDEMNDEDVDLCDGEPMVRSAHGMRRKRGMDSRKFLMA